MIPFGPRLNTVFASRWKAAIWAGGILLTAYCSVPSPEDTTEVQVRAETPHRVNPWALDPK